jgi:hypothetical protein
MSSNVDVGDGRRGGGLRIPPWSVAAVILLLIPALAMQVSDQWDWNLADFVAAAVLLTVATSCSTENPSPVPRFTVSPGTVSAAAAAMNPSAVSSTNVRSRTVSMLPSRTTSPASACVMMVGTTARALWRGP